MRFYNDPVEISADVWAEVLVDRTVTEERDLIVLRLVYESVNHEMHASEIAPHLNYTGHAPVNARIARFSKRVAEKTGVRLPMNDNGAPRWWNVPFWGCIKSMCTISYPYLEYEGNTKSTPYEIYAQCARTVTS